MPLSELVRQIISELCLKDYVATFISGQQALANLDEFVKFVENYEKNSSQKVYGLLNQIHCLKMQEWLLQKVIRNKNQTEL